MGGCVGYESPASQSIQHSTYIQCSDTVKRRPRTERTARGVVWFGVARAIRLAQLDVGGRCRGKAPRLLLQRAAPRAQAPRGIRHWCGAYSFPLFRVPAVEVVLRRRYSSRGMAAAISPLALALCKHHHITHTMAGRSPCDAWGPFAHNSDGMLGRTRGGNMVRAGCGDGAIRGEGGVGDNEREHVSMAWRERAWAAHRTHHWQQMAASLWHVCISDASIAAQCGLGQSCTLLTRFGMRSGLSIDRMRTRVPRPR